MKVGIIRNPASGRGRGANAWPNIESKLRAVLGTQLCAVEQTSASGSATSQAARMASEGLDVVVAAGGDGTISQVMQGVLGSSSALGILPVGTGNDFARTLGLLSVEDAIAALGAGSRRRIDVGEWRQADRSGHFLNVAGCGFDACVAERINTGFRRLRGQTAYLAAILQTLRAYECLRLEIEVDGERLGGPTMLCAIANARSYGGGIKVAPTAELSDGLLDLVLVGEFGRLEFLRSFPLVLRGAHLKHPKVIHRTFKHMKLSSQPASPFLVDGELLPPGDVEVEVVPAALDVICPLVAAPPKKS